MATLNLGGRKITVDDSFLTLSPQEQQKTVDEIEQSLSGASPPPIAPPVSHETQAPQSQVQDSAYGTGMNFIAGLGRGAIGMVSIPARAGDYLANKAIGGIDYLRGIPPDITANRIAKTDKVLSSYGLNPSDMQQNVESVTGAWAQPQTTRERFADTIGQFVSSAPAGGPTGLLGRAISLTLAGAGSEGAGMLAEGQGPVVQGGARLAGALLGGLTPSTASRMIKGNPMKAMREAAPTFEQNKSMTNAAYTRLEDMGVHVPHEDLVQINSGIANDLRGFTSESAPQSMAIASKIKQAQIHNETELANKIKEAQSAQSKAESLARESRATGNPRAADHTNQALEAANNTLQVINEAKAGKKVFFNQLDEFRKEVGATAAGGQGITATDQMAAAKIKSHIDDALKKTDASPEINAAREMARRSILAREAMKIEKKSKWYTSGDESGLRNQFSSFGKREGDSLTPYEAAAAKKVTRREGVHGLLNTTGSKLTQTLLAGAGIGGGVGILPVAVGLGTSMAARAISGAMTNKASNNFLKTVLAGKSAQAQAAYLLKLQKAKTISDLSRLGLLSGSNQITNSNR